MISGTAGTRRSLRIAVLLLCALGAPGLAWASIPKLSDLTTTSLEARALPELPSGLEQLADKQNERAACGSFCAEPLRLELTPPPLFGRARNPWRIFSLELDERAPSFSCPGEGVLLGSGLFGGRGALGICKYANDNPTRYVDPDGHESLAEAAAREKERRESLGTSAPTFTNQGSGRGDRQTASGAEIESEYPAWLSERLAEAREQRVARGEPGWSGPAVVTEEGTQTAAGSRFSPENLANSIKQDTRASLRTAGQYAGTAKGLSEAGLEVGFDPVNNVVILATGKTITGHEASRYIAAIGIATPVAVVAGGKIVRVVIKSAERAEEAALDVARAERRLEAAEREAYVGARAVERAEADAVAATRGAARGSRNPVTREAARTGQEAHRQIEAELKAQGYDTEVTIKLEEGLTVRKDAVKGSEAIIIKPDTPTGRAAAEERAKLMREHEYDPNVRLYDPTDPRYQPGSPTHIGPKKKP